MHKKMFLCGLFLCAVVLLVEYMAASGAMHYIQVPGIRIYTADLPAEFHLFRKWFMGAMLLFGLSIAAIGSRQMLIDRRTARCGKEGFGVIADVVTLKAEIDGVAQVRVHVLVLQKNGALSEMKEYFDGNRSRFKVGEIVRVKYTHRDMNILSKYDSGYLDPEIAKKLDRECRLYQAKKYPFEW